MDTNKQRMVFIERKHQKILIVEDHQSSSDGFKLILEGLWQFQGCHEYACQVAEQGEDQGADIEDVYEMAYELCMEDLH